VFPLHSTFSCLVIAAKEKDDSRSWIIIIIVVIGIVVAALLAFSAYYFWCLKRKKGKIKISTVLDILTTKIIFIFSLTFSHINNCVEYLNVFLYGV
jgi:flagellar basal body-associated protein FliL